MRESGVNGQKSTTDIIRTQRGSQAVAVPDERVAGDRRDTLSREAGEGRVEGLPLPPERVGVRAGVTSISADRAYPVPSSSQSALHSCD